MFQFVRLKHSERLDRPEEWRLAEDDQQKFVNGKHLRYNSRTYKIMLM